MAMLVHPIRPKRRFRLRAAAGPRPPAAGKAAPEEAAQASARPAGAAGRRFVLLIVDDDTLMTDMLPRRMRRHLRPDVEIKTASTAEEAFALVRAVYPNVVLSDYNLRQVHTGLDVLRATREHAPHAARILFSGHAMRELDGLLDGDIDAYVEKPMRLDELIPQILDAIQRATGEDLRIGGAAGV